MVLGRFCVFSLLFFFFSGRFVFGCDQRSSRNFVYTREELFALSLPALWGARPDLPVELRKKRRGSRAGTKMRERRRKFKPAIPSVLMGNVRSLANKMDELSGLVRTQKEYAVCSIMCFTETWLHADFPDHSATLPGFTTSRADRNTVLSEKILKWQPINIKTNLTAVNKLRLDIAIVLLQETDDLSKVCHSCGMEESDNPHWICCDICERWFHHECVLRPDVDGDHLCPACL
ncbi:uncharacterized protein LOC133536408 [Nerophis ophidion]|uniref:uncharacterized protein LOC133536408 n=1 Tax=Nerophis ophidion TaxID=159077 RepID=UPI002AE052CF|nr:uncharacterized protein LOC133536408 [Nerophis ophidion]